VRSEPLEPVVEIPEQTPLVVVDEHARRDVHGIDQAQAFPDAALAEGLFDVRSDVDVIPSVRRAEPQLFAVTFHKKLKIQNEKIKIDESSNG
jgi:hypothetical protein